MGNILYIFVFQCNWLIFILKTCLTSYFLQLYTQCFSCCFSLLRVERGYKVWNTVLTEYISLHFSEDGQYFLKVLIPSYAAGSIIGKGGQTIVQLQKETGATIKLSKSKDFYPGRCNGEEIVWWAPHRKERSTCVVCCLERIFKQYWRLYLDIALLEYVVEKFSDYFYCWLCLFPIIVVLCMWIRPVARWFGYFWIILISKKIQKFQDRNLDIWHQEIGFFWSFQTSL